MLFYVKKSLRLDAAVTLLLAGTGYAGIRFFDLPLVVSITPVAIAQGVAGFAIITAWTFAVQKGYALVKGERYARELTEALAANYAGASLLQAIAGG
jgi:hypothetical protein